MALTAIVSSSLPTLGVPPTYYQQGNAAIPVVVKVYNSDPTAVQLRQVYLTQGDVPNIPGTQTINAISLGEPTFRYIASSLNNTNNVIPAGGTGSYDALFIPQVEALTDYPYNQYIVNIGAVAQRFGEATSVRATPASFVVFTDPTSTYSLVNNYQLWNKSVNIRPPQNAGFDYQVYVNRTLQSGQTYLVPQNEVYFSSSNTSVATIVENTPDELATTGSNSQLSASGGCISIVGVGTTNIFARLGSGAGPLIASGSLKVLNSLPVGIEIYPANRTQVYNPAIPQTSTLLYDASVVYSDGSKQSLGGAGVWSISNNNIGTFDIFTPGELTINNSDELVSGATIPVIISVRISGTSFFLEASTNLYIRKV